MKIQVIHTNEAIKAEQRHFLFCTAAGKLLVASCIIISGALLAAFYISKNSVEVVSISGVIAIFTGYATATVLLALGYFWVNYGGHVSNFFEDMGIRVYEFLEADGIISIDDLGVGKRVSVKDIKISCKMDRIYMVNNSEVYSMPNTLEAKKFVKVLRSAAASLKDKINDENH